jgi:hypothetical protein
VSSSARNPSISSFEYPDNYNLYVEASINNTNDFCDTSTIFRNDPVAITCVNQPTCIDLELFDAESDSIVATFINPMHAENTNLPYDSGYSISFPMSLDTALEINNATGLFCFTPLTPIVTAYAIKVSSYRDGNLISEIQRDVMLYVVNCINSQPDIMLASGTTTDTFVCVNTPICLDLITVDPTPTDSTWISWDESIPTASFTITPGLNEQGSFCWTPSNSDLELQPHCFNVYVSDNNCPVSQSSQKTYCITVYDSATCAILYTPEINTNYQLRIYPQPATDFINVTFVNPNKHLTFSIHDILGNKILERKINVNENKFSLSIEKLIPGIYLVALTNTEGMVVSQNKIVRID